MAHHSSWICCQLGAREHYAIPRALHQSDRLSHLITDAWVPPHSALTRLPKALSANLSGRFHPDLASASVKAFTSALIQFELAQRLGDRSNWQVIAARNHWFQQRVIRQLRAIKDSEFETTPLFFTYSYAALDLLRYAKARGWKTVLGQIDPGPIEETLVIAEHQNHPELSPSWQPVPPGYWQSWQAECDLADNIIVNSAWSRDALQQAGITSQKIHIIPLAYQPSAQVAVLHKAYPTQFSADRPLRVLFLGQIILRKGIAALLRAAQLLGDRPIEFWLVGPSEVSPQPSSNIRWVGPVPRSAVADYYQHADVFLFPTLSDGFGLTQLEAQAWKLPLIASQFCGEVVKDQVNGLVLPEVTGEAIAEALTICLENPAQLAQWSSQSWPIKKFSLLQLSERLQTI